MARIPAQSKPKTQSKVRRTLGGVTRRLGVTRPKGSRR